MLLSPALPRVARAEVPELRLATQYGLGAMPMILMQQRKLVEKQLAASGLSGTGVSWRQFSSGNAMNEGLLSGSLDVVSSGTTVFVTLWSKARGTPSAVRGIGAVSALPLYLLTRDPAVHRIEDLGDNDRIAVTTLKVSVHAMLLQMAAGQIWGPAATDRLDRLTVQIPHGDAAVAMISGRSEINNHFSAPPFQEIELRDPNIRRIASAEQILGGNPTYMVAYATEQFRRDNPNTYGAVVAALRDAQDLIRRNPAEAAQVYLDFAHDQISPAETATIITDAGSSFALRPQKVGVLADFMRRQGLIKSTPPSWHDLFFGEAQETDGS